MTCHLFKKEILELRHTCLNNYRYANDGNSLVVRKMTNENERERERERERE